LKGSNGIDESLLCQKLRSVLSIRIANPEEPLEWAALRKLPLAAASQPSCRLSASRPAKVSSAGSVKQTSAQARIARWRFAKSVRRGPSQA
jgi:hypothetical protein